MVSYSKLGAQWIQRWSMEASATTIALMEPISRCWVVPMAVYLVVLVLQEGEPLMPTYTKYDIAGQLEAADQRARQLFPLRDYSVNGFICFGDGAYPRGPNMLKGIIGPANAMEKEFNHACNKVRVAVEQIFHVLVSNFPYVDTARKMKIMLQPVALKVKCAVVFHNWHTCIYGNQISEYFGVCPPSLAQYLAL
jgi:hypothetical protein